MTSTIPHHDPRLNGGPTTGGPATLPALSATLDATIPANAVSRTSQSIEVILESADRLARFPSPANAQAFAALVPEFAVVLGPPKASYPALPDPSDQRATPSERITGERNPELDRFVVSLRSYFELRQGDDGYEAFVGDQPSETRLSRDTYSKLSSVVTQCIDSPPQQLATVLGLLYNAAAKGPAERWAALSGAPAGECRTAAVACERIRSATDDHAAVLSYILDKLPEWVPTVHRHLAAEDVSQFKRAHLSTPNVGQLMLLESMEATLRSYPALSEGVKGTHFVHYLLAVCGARGHEVGSGCLTMEEHRARQWLDTHRATKAETPDRIYAAVLEERASLYGLNPHSPEGRALVRVCSMAGLSNHTEAKLLADIFRSDLLTADERHAITTELGYTGISGPVAILPRYMPALLTNIARASTELSREREEAFATALKTVAHMFTIGREHVSASERDKTDGYVSITVRDAASHARVIPFCPASCVRVETIAGGDRYTIHPEWIALAGERRREEAAVIPMPPRERVKHKTLEIVGDYARRILSDLSLRLLERRLDSEHSAALARSVGTIFHAASYVALFAPKDTEVPPSVLAITEKNTERMIADLKTLLEHMESSVGENDRGLVPESIGEVVDRSLEALRGLDKLALDAPAFIKVTVAPSANHQAFTIAGEQGATVIRFQPLADVGPLRAATDRLADCGPVVTVLDIRRTGETGLSAADEIDLFRRWVGPSSALFSPQFSLDDGGARKPLRSGESEGLGRRLERSRDLLEKINEDLGRTVDLVTLASPFCAYHRNPTLIALVEARKLVAASARRWMLEPNEANKALLVEVLREARRRARVGDSVAHTGVISRNSSTASEVIQEMANLSASFGAPPDDIRVPLYGAFTRDISTRLLGTLLDLGSRIVTCRRDDGALVGYCVYLPGHRLEGRGADDLFGPLAPYGRVSFINYLFVSPDASASLPVYQLLTNRYRLEAGEHDATAFLVLSDNRRSIAVNCSEVGGGVLSPTGVAKPFQVGGSSHLLGVNEVSGPELLTAVAPLSRTGNDIFASVRFGDTAAVEIADRAFRRDIPGLFPQDGQMVARLYQRAVNYRTAITTGSAKDPMQRYLRVLEKWIADAERSLVSTNLGADHGAASNVTKERAQELIASFPIPRVDSRQKRPRGDRS